MASYVCSVQQAGRYGRAHEICVLESGPSGPPAGSGPEGWSDDEVAALAARVQDDVMACLPPSRADLELPVVLTTTGELRRLGNTVGPGPSACVDRVLSAVRLEQGREERSMVLRLARTTAGGESRPARATSPGDPAQAARAAVDGRARALLACTGEDAMALEVSWARDGRLDGAPRGVRPGSPEAECVRGILRGLRIGARGASGSTLHAIQR